MLIIPFICTLFFLSNKFFLHRFLSSYERQSLQILYTPTEVEVYCEKKTAKLKFILSYFLFSISQSNVMYREICVKDFSITTAPRILKFGTNIG